MAASLDYTIPFPIRPKTLKSSWPNLFMMGSCFAETQGKKLSRLGLKVYQNPFGIVYNPVSIAGLLYRIHHQKRYTTDDFVHHNNSYFSLEHHGKFTYQNLNDAVLHSNTLLETSATALKDAEVVILTLGTSIVFHHIEEKRIVANCHSIPNKAFESLQLTFETTKNTLLNALHTLRDVNPKAHIICTVSPVRHLRSGVIESSRSKSTLLSALHEVLQESKNSSYFPAYEIFMDELRDYRFSKPDLMHPNAQAEDYVFNRFVETYFTEATQHTLQAVEKFRKLEAHQSTTDPIAHQQLVKKKMKELKEQYPFLYFNES